MHVSVPPLVEVMRGERVSLNCTPSKKPDHFVLEWFLIERSGARRRLASAEQQGSELQLQRTVHDPRGRRPPYQLDPQGSLVLAEAQVGDERDYVCVVTAGAAGTAEATSRLRVFAQPEAAEVLPNTGTLSVMDSAPQIATCSSRNGNPAPQISWYRNGRLLELPTEMNEEGYVTIRTVREASGLLSLSSTLYLRVRKADRTSSFHCVAQYSLPGDRHGRLDSPAFNLTLHYPTEHVHLWVGSPSTTEGWVREGDSVQLLCEGDGSPNPEYTFFRLQDKQEEVLSTNLEGKLTLEGVNRSQSGIYGCRVEDFDAAEDVVLTRTLGVNVSYLDPLELSAGKELSVFLNSSRMAVTCSARAQPAPTLRWTKDSVPLENGPTLSLGPFTFDSAGTYVCEASMPSVPLVSRTQSFRLLVQGSPELRAKELEPKAEGSWTEGDDVELICSARGYPEPELTWSQPGGSPAERAQGGQGWVSSSLTLRVTSTLGREGVSCEASNSHGRLSHVFHFGMVAPQAAQAGVAVMAVAVSVGLLLLVVAAFYCMRRKGRPGCCRRREKGTPAEPETWRLRAPTLSCGHLRSSPVPPAPPSPARLAMSLPSFLCLLARDPLPGLASGRGGGRWVAGRLPSSGSVTLPGPRIAAGPEPRAGLGRGWRVAGRGYFYLLPRAGPPT
ncbi:basal cell adhesion molecule isoform X2 [Heterocephalus glaber]|nr:basal cell adhesion molecule isoform X2 [Heterocephalus glaber]